MRALSYILSLLTTIAIALWLGTRMIRNTDPADPANVAIVLFLIFLIVGCLSGLLSWGIIRRFKGEDRYDLSLRHGFWGGLIIVLLPIFRWINALNILVVSTVLLIIFSVESLILLQEGRDEMPAVPEQAEEHASETESDTAQNS